jgi:hypothetical protein
MDYLTNFFLLNNEHNWKNPCISFKNQPTYASNNRNFMKGDPYLNLVFGDASSYIRWCNKSLVM